MTDSNPPHDPSQPARNEGDSSPEGATGNSRQLDRSSGNGPPPPDPASFATWVERQEKLLGLMTKQAHWRKANAAATEAEAIAETASEIAKAEPRRQDMTLRERTVVLLLLALAVLTVVGLSIALFVLRPGLLSLGLLLGSGLFGGWAWRRGKGNRTEDDREDDP